jgi:hypothetical protein
MKRKKLSNVAIRYENSPTVPQDMGGATLDGFPFSAYIQYLKAEFTARRRLALRAGKPKRSNSAKKSNTGILAKYAVLCMERIAPQWRRFCFNFKYCMLVAFG